MSIDRLPPVGHVGVVVADMDRALEEIRQIFGIDGAGKVYDFTLAAVLVGAGSLWLFWGI